MDGVAVYSTFEVRLRAVKAVEQGMPTGQVAIAYGINRSTLYRWCDHYQQEGIDGLCRQEGSGRPKLLQELTEEALCKIVLTSALSYGFESDLWTVGRLHQIITEKFCVNVSKDTIWRRLVDAGLTYQKPEREYYEANEEVKPMKKYANTGDAIQYRKSSVAYLKIRQFCISKTKPMCP